MSHKTTIYFTLLVTTGSFVQAMQPDITIHVAAAQGDYQAVKNLLDKDKTLVNNQQDKNRNTPLHFAAEHGHKDIVKLLLKCGAKINQQYGNGNTPLLLATEHGHKDIVKLLLKCGAKINQQNGLNETPLHFATRDRHTDIAELLLAHDANVDLQNVYKKTPLHYAAEKGLTKVAELLLKHNANVNQQNEWLRTPLHYAAINGHTDIAELLLAHGANVDQQEQGLFEYTPLLYAAENGHTEIVKLLLKHNANVDSQGEKKKTPLHEAAAYGHIEVVELLLLRGAAPIDHPLVEKINGIIMEKNLRAAQLTLCMGLHQRLGSQSPIRFIITDNIKQLCSFLQPEHFAQGEILRRRMQIAQHAFCLGLHQRTCVNSPIRFITNHNITQICSYLRPEHFPLAYL